MGFFVSEPAVTKDAKSDFISFDLRCIKKHWGATMGALDIVSGCEVGSHGVGIDKVVAKAFLAQLGAKPRPWLTAQRVPRPPVMNADDVEGTLNDLITEQL